MSKLEYLRPAGLLHNPAFSQVVTATGARTVYTAGQVSIDERGALVGAGDLEAQATQALRNIGLALAAAGASYSDVVKITTYVVNYKPEHRAIIGKARVPFFSGWEGEWPPSASNKHTKPPLSVSRFTPLGARALTIRRIRLSPTGCLYPGHARQADRTTARGRTPLRQGHACPFAAGTRPDRSLRCSLTREAAKRRSNKSLTSVATLSAPTHALV
jgi:enamine deaminase RidA (YjgF/YER057c/UK114 family)